MILLTNLPPLNGFQHAPCVAPGTDVIAASKFVLIDHESDDALIEEGDDTAIARAGMIISRIRDVTRAKLGWYNWPQVYRTDREHIANAASQFGPLVAKADWFAPSCYSFRDGRTCERAAVYAECLAIVPARRPVIACVSDGIAVGEGGACTPEEIVEQVAAARVVGATGLYVWSGLEYRASIASMLVEQGHPAELHVQKARADLLGIWNFTIRSWDRKSVLAEYRRVSGNILTAFAKEVRR